MKEMQIFKNGQFGEVRVLEMNGEPWFVGKDVAEILGYKDTVNALKSHVDKEDKMGWQVTTPSRGVQNAVIINESGLYSLILSSKLPTARQFKRWVTSEVLPAIRRHGAYLTPDTLEEAILNPDTMIKLCTALKDEQDRRKALEAANSALTVKNQIMAPKAEYFDELVDRNLLTNFRDTAKELGIKQNVFVTFLLDKKYIYRDKNGKLRPYADKNDGLFELKECYNKKTEWKGLQTLITPKGRETFRLLFPTEVA